MDGADPVIDLFLAAYRREFDYYQEAARLCAQLCDQELRGAGKRVVVTYRAKNPERLADKLLRRKQEEKKEYKTAQDIYADIIDLSGVRVALYFPGDAKEVDRIIRATFRPMREPKTFPDGRPPKRAKQFDGYHATHYLVGLKTDKLGSDQHRYADARIEIQVASVLMHGWAEVEHDLVYKPLSGDLSDAEYDILDELNGLVLASEIALRRLQVAFDQRVNQANEAFTNHYELAAFLHRELKLAARDAPEPDMGRVDLLFQLLRRYEKNQPGALRPLLSQVVTDPETERPIGEQLIDLFIGNSAERYASYETIRSFDLGSPIYRTGPDEGSERAIGSFLKAWIRLERLIGQRTGHGKGLWFRGPIPGIPPSLFKESMSLRQLRNETVHGIQVPASEALLSAAARLREIAREVEPPKPPPPKRGPRRKSSS
jgi:ppGpp synthetase/RelA/SpoT-type nucleotidyltranferase